MSQPMFTPGESEVWGEAGESSTPVEHRDDNTTTLTPVPTHLTRDTDILAARHHKTGYRDGAAKGQEETQQHGFNAGFALGVTEGWEWGRVYGRASALFIQAQQGREERDSISSSSTGDKDSIPVLQELCDDIHTQARQRRNGRTQEWGALVAAGWHDPHPDDPSVAVPSIDSDTWTQAALTDIPTSLLTLQDRSRAVFPTRTDPREEGPAAATTTS